MKQAYIRPLSRREFLKSIAAFGLYSLLPTGCAQSTMEQTVIISPQNIGNIPSIGVINLTKRLKINIPSDILGHSIIQNPKEPYKFVMISQRPGKVSCEFDLRNNSVTRYFNAKDNRFFYGHGEFLPNSDLMLCSEFGDTHGYITVRNAKTFAVESEFPSFGLGPHDLKLFSDRKRIIIANGGLSNRNGITDYQAGSNFESRLSTVDIHSQTLVDQFVMETPFISMRHIYVSKQDHIAVGLKRYNTQDITPSLMIKHKNKPYYLVEEPRHIVEKMNSIGLSLSISDAHNVVGVTCPTGNIVAFWSLDTYNYLTSYEINAPSGIIVTSDDEHFIVSSETDAPLKLNAKTLEKETFFHQQTNSINYKHSGIFTYIG